MDAEGEKEGNPARRRAMRSSKVMALLGVFVAAAVLIIISRAIRRSADSDLPDAAERH
jgi:hypothetical protein